MPSATSARGTPSKLKLTSLTCWFATSTGTGVWSEAITTGRLTAIVCWPGGMGAVRPTVTTATPSFNSAIVPQGKQLEKVVPTKMLPAATVSCLSL